MSYLEPFQSVALFENTFRHQLNKKTGKIDERKFVFDKHFGDGEGQLPVVPDRYRLIWMPGCPHSNKAMIHGRSGQYSTVTEHMPQEHQKYLEWNGERFRKWADSIGINTSKVVDAILTSGRIEQQSYRSCMGLLKLAEKYSPEKLEQVCAKALSYSGKPSYKSIKNLLAATKDAPDTESESSQAVKPHGITRGARYYGGKKS